eukprot:TRINITY_DN10066_c0_g5_i1.p1 TRINITY_DN10066_c0_g5~~TRINITY_DN10066_c0_g5_i1.p1  ORF type:complete len:912 (-),score=171.94 TRINITY_DN10066_c0_g5_i1:116-2806(-)
MADRLGIDEADVARCRAAFDSADIDKSGGVDVKELRGLLESLNGKPLSDEEAVALQAKFKHRKTGILDFVDFLEVFTSSPEYRRSNATSMIQNMVQETYSKNKSLPAEKRVQFDGVETRHVRKYLHAEIRQMEACLSLPESILFVLTYFCAAYFHFRPEITHAINHAIEYDLEQNANFAFSEAVPLEYARTGHKNLYDVNSFADAWSWMNLGLVPLLWPEGWDVNEARASASARCKSSLQAMQEFGWDESLLSGEFPDAIFGGACPEAGSAPPLVEDWYGSPRGQYYLWFNTVIGGVRLQQEQVKVTSCSDEFGQNLHRGICTEEGRHWISMQKETYLDMDSSRMNTPRAETIFLLAGSTQKDIRQQLRAHENAAWLSPLTSKLMVTFPTYNPHLQAIAVTNVMISVNRAGHFFRAIDSEVVWLQAFHGWYSYVADAMWCLFALKELVTFLMAIGSRCRKHGFCGGLRATLLDGDARMDLLLSLANIILLMTVCVHRADVSVASASLTTARGDVPGTWQSTAMREKFFDTALHLSIASKRRRYVYAAYPFFLLANLFEAFAGQPRLSLVTATMKNAAVDLIHFGFVFIAVFSLFAGSAMMLFASHLESFATFARAADTSFHVLLGDYDWDSMTKAGELPARVWFVLFTCVMTLVMLNMLLAIVMDVYSETRGQLRTDAETMWSQVFLIYRRWKELRDGKRTSLKYIDQCLASAGETESWNTQKLMAQVPGIAADQASRILLASLEKQEAKDSQSLSAAVVDIQEINARIGAAEDMLGSLLKLSELTASLVESHSTHSSHPPQIDADAEKDKRSRGFKEEPRQPDEKQVTELDQIVAKLDVALQLKDTVFQQQAQIGQLQAMLQQERAWRLQPSPSQAAGGFCGAPGIGQKIQMSAV